MARTSFFLLLLGLDRTPRLSISRRRPPERVRFIGDLAFGFLAGLLGVAAGSSSSIVSKNETEIEAHTSNHTASRASR